MAAGRHVVLEELAGTELLLATEDVALAALPPHQRGQRALHGVRDEERLYPAALGCRHDQQARRIMRGGIPVQVRSCGP